MSSSDGGGLIAPATSITQNFTKKIKKGDGNNGEPDTLEKLEMEKRPKIGLN